MDEKNTKQSGSAFSKLKSGSRWIVVASISIMVGLVFSNAVFRYVLNKGFPPSEELARFFFIWTIFLGIITAYKDGNHVSVTILTDQLKGTAKTVVETIATLLSIGILLVILYGGIIYTIKSSSYNTVATDVNFGLIAVSIVVMSVSLLFLIISKTIKNPPFRKKG